MEFEIINGAPTPEEHIAIQKAMSQHNSGEQKQLMPRSVYGLPQLRQPLQHQINFGGRRFTK